MPKLRNLSGDEVVKIFERLGFIAVSQRGSHVKLKREGKLQKQTITIPLHKELDRGTVRAIYRQALKYVPENELSPYFYTDQ